MLHKKIKLRKKFIFFVLFLLLIQSTINCNSNFKKTFSWLLNTKITSETSRAEKVKKCLFWSASGLAFYWLHLIGKYYTKQLVYNPVVEKYREQIREKYKDLPQCLKCLLQLLPAQSSSLTEQEFEKLKEAKFVEFAKLSKEEQNVVISSGKNLVFKVVSFFLFSIAIRQFTKRKIPNKFYSFTFIKTVLLFAPIIGKFIKTIFSNKNKDKKKINPKTTKILPILTGLTAVTLVQLAINKTNPRSLNEKPSRLNIVQKIGKTFIRRLHFLDDSFSTATAVVKFYHLWNLSPELLNT